MIYLRTGTPGASKTLNTLKEIIEDPINKGREKFYYNIKLLLLDWEVCNSFQGYFYGEYLPTVKNKSILKRVSRIHDDDRFVDDSDFPYLQQEYANFDPLALWLKWARKLYDEETNAIFDEIIETKSEYSFEDFRPLNLHFQQINYNDFIHWYQLPRGSVIIGDEVQRVFVKRKIGSEVPKFSSELETHRHGGYDIHLVTQNAMLIDSHPRNLINKHIHFHNYLNGEKVVRYEYSKAMNTNDRKELMQALKHTITRDANYYGLYYSAEIHTAKVNLKPIIRKFKPLLFILPLLLAATVYSCSAFQSFANKGETESEPESEIKQEPQKPLQESKPREVTTIIGPATPKNIPAQSGPPKESRRFNFTPDDAFKPYSAPAFYNLAKVSEIPTVACIQVSQSCHCSTQQGTRYVTQKNVCEFFSQYGYFNPVNGKGGKSDAKEKE